MNRRIAIFDTSLGSNNLGDVIIMDAVRGVLKELFGEVESFPTIATHRYMSREDRKTLRDCELAIVGGTNLVSSHMFFRANWHLIPIDIFLPNSVVLMGVGWRAYQGDPSWLSRAFFRRVLSSRYLHCVRDEYTFHKLSREVKNVIFTGCPTLWPLTPDKCRTIPTTKASTAIASLTYYSRDRSDAEFIALLKRRYEKVLLWCQWKLDVEYARSLEVCCDIPIIDDVISYDRIVSRGDIDQVGTRVHGGIRALQRGCRALILEIDHRAREMARSCNLPVVDRHDISAIDDWIDRSPPVSIRLPWDAIDAWKLQFRLANLESTSPSQLPAEAAERVPRALG